MRKNFWESERLRIRALEEKDLQMYIQNRHEPDSVRQWYEDSLMFPMSEKETKDDYEKTVTDYTKEDKRIFILETLDGMYMGEISIWLTSARARFFRYGIFLDESARGKGLGKEALIIVLDFYFNELNYRKAAPCVYSYNSNSQKFHEKFGFKLEGIVKDEIYSRGQYHDMRYYAMFKDEFNERYGAGLWLWT